MDNLVGKYIVGMSRIQIAFSRRRTPFKHKLCTRNYWNYYCISFRSGPSHKTSALNSNTQRPPSTRVSGTVCIRSPPAIDIHNKHHIIQYGWLCQPYRFVSSAIMGIGNWIWIYNRNWPHWMWAMLSPPPFLRWSEMSPGWRLWQCLAPNQLQSLHNEIVFGGYYY